jgi:hypothetical protein
VLPHARAPDNVPWVPATQVRGVNVVTVALDWHDELVLMAELSSVNNQIARFVLGLLDADAGRREPVSPTDEDKLGTRLVDLGCALQDRALHRAELECNKMAVEVPGSLRRQLEPSRKVTAAGGQP